MTRDLIIDSISANYGSFVDYINDLSTSEYTFAFPNKWSASQQLAHINLCVKPLVLVFCMDKAAIAQTFGVIDKSGRDYETVLSDYLTKLKEGGKAPGRFVPEATIDDQKDSQVESLKNLVIELCSRIETFTEDELDTLIIPHPLLGKLTLREMLYNAIYHVRHHQLQAQANLENK